MIKKHKSSKGYDVIVRFSMLFEKTPLYRKMSTEKEPSRLQRDSGILYPDLATRGSSKDNNS